MRPSALAATVFTGVALLLTGFLETSPSEALLADTPRYWSVAAGIAALTIPVTESVWGRTIELSLVAFAVLVRSWFLIRDIGFNPSALVPTFAWFALLFALIAMVTTDAEKPLSKKLPGHL